MLGVSFHVLFWVLPTSANVDLSETARKLQRAACGLSETCDFVAKGSTLSAGPDQQRGSDASISRYALGCNSASKRLQASCRAIIWKRENARTWKTLLKGEKFLKNVVRCQDEEVDGRISHA